MSQRLFWSKIWLWRIFQYGEHPVIFRKTVWDDFSFMIRCVMLVQATITRWVHCGHDGMNSGCLNNVPFALRGPRCAKKMSPIPLHHHYQPALLVQGRMDSWFDVVYAKFEPIIWILQQISRLIRPGIFFLFVSCLTLVSLCKLMLPLYQLKAV